MNVQQSYREAAVLGASPVGQVALLYEKMIDDLHQVSEAIEWRDIQRRSDRIKHALMIVGNLQSSLDFDRGGKVARQLETFYDSLRDRLVQLQCYPSTQRVAQLITDLLTVREAWMQVDRAENPTRAAAVAQSPTQASAFKAVDRGSDHAHVDWQG